MFYHESRQYSDAALFLGKFSAKQSITFLQIVFTYILNPATIAIFQELGNMSRHAEFILT
jgi:hypothetical protein